MFLASILFFFHIRSVFLHRVIQFWKNLDEQVKGRSTKKLKILNAVPYVLQVKVHVFGFNVFLTLSQWRVPRPSYPFRRNFERSGKGSFTEKAKIVNRGSECSPWERICSKLQYDPYLISVACSYTKLSISVIIWALR